ncbi:hypothetical protein SCHPADRAFT_835141 [Schizopora paradoxa]|uniref:Reverse transcriptase zinc-binding domain-containing protein n=1 Tax=Schizopora paradoxa TaxID=27342 RepID=A0A0H2RUV7_9AGAM|nr:hypothetical protein SCHPADRAFT_835141 [Schizopora paradoxa]
MRLGRSRSLTIETSSKRLVKILTDYDTVEENQGYTNVPEKHIMRATIASLRRHPEPIIFKLVDHLNPTSGLRKARDLANAALNKPSSVQMCFDPCSNPEPGVAGAKLSAMTQALAYKSIAIYENERKPVQTRRSTSVNLAAIQRFCEDTYQKVPSESEIWKGLRTRDLDKKCQEFCWKLIHDAYFVGKRWLHIPGYEDRGYCKHCDNVVESMDHILFECNAVGQKQIWELTKSLWNKRQSFWPAPSLGSVTAFKFINDPNADTRLSPGDKRLFAILAPESARLIWRLRCERVIEKENKNFSRQEIFSRWKSMINGRLHTERLATNTKFGRCALPPLRVKKTWEGLLENEDELPDDWSGAGEVLVGIGVDPPS